MLLASLGLGALQLTPSANRQKPVESNPKGEPGDLTAAPKGTPEHC